MKEIIEKIIASFKVFFTGRRFTWTPDLFKNPVQKAVNHYELLLSVIYAKRSDEELKNYHSPNKIGVYEAFYNKYLKDRFMGNEGYLSEDEFYQNLLNQRLTKEKTATELTSDEKSKLIEDVKQYMQLHDTGMVEYSLGWVGFESGILFVFFSLLAGFFFNRNENKSIMVGLFLVFATVAVGGFVLGFIERRIYKAVNEDSDNIDIIFKYLPVNISLCFEMLEKERIYLNKTLNSRKELKILKDIEDTGRIKQSGDHYVLYGDLERFVEWILKSDEYRHLEPEFIFDCIYKNDKHPYSLGSIKKAYQNVLSCT